jgi:diguanylate cyclase (GGDEF)-like protein
MLRKINRLSHKKVLTKIKQGNYADGGGLYLQVSRFKTKSWVFRFTLKKISREMGLGPLHTVTLAEARLKAENCRKQLREGIDPIEKRRKKLSAKARKSAKVGSVFRARNHENYFNQIVSAIRDELEPHNMLKAAASSTTHVLNIAGCRIYRRNKDDEFCTAAEYGDSKKTEFLEFKLATFSASENLFDMDIGNFKFLAAATNYRKRINGAISMWKYSNGKPWDEVHYSLIKEVANQLGIANEQISNHERIIALSRTDSMTGLLNRRAFYEEDLPRRISRLKRNKELAALFFVDMDNFKMVNDVHGHQAGDDALLILRDLLMDISRPGDVIARLGGDEFAMWLDGITPEVIKKRAAELISAAECLIKFSGNKDYPLGISVGVAIFNPERNESLEELVARADEAMYQVKNAEKRGFQLSEFPAIKRKNIDKLKKNSN